MQALFGPVVLEADCAVKHQICGSMVLTVSDKITQAFKLKFIVWLGEFEAGLYPSIDDLETVWIDGLL
jgi:hypothetical protein